MSFYSEASLAYVASAGAGKDGKAYSMKPVDGTGDFTFSRGSNLAATRVGPTGLIEKGRENLLLQSNQFDTTWVNSNTTETSGQAGYDGTNDAWLLSKSAANGMVYQSISSSGVQTISIYAKKGTNSWMQIYAVGSSNVRAYYDLENGVLGGYALNAIERKIEDVGNDWYRCSVTFNSSLSAVRFFVSDGSNNDSGTSGSIYIQDSQLEIGLAASEPIESGATTGKAGLLEDEPRFDYSGGATCPSLLLEPSRTQSVPYTEYFGSSYYNLAGGVVLTENYGISPEGVKNSARINAPAANGGWYTDGKVVAIGETHTCSIFAKLVSGSTSSIVRFGFSLNGDKLTRYDLSDGTINSADPNTTSSIEDYGNGWYRLIQTITTTTSGTLREVIYSYTQAVDYEIWGHQVEQGSYPTSYIPNHSGGSVTRGAEKQEITGLTSTQLNQTEGSIYLELQTYSTDAGRFVITSYPDGASGDTMRFIFENNIQFFKVDTGGLSYSINPTASKIKVIGTYSGTELKLCVNGGAVQSSSGNFSFTNQPTKVYTHAFIDTIRLFAEVDQILYFPTALSDADCIALTS